MEFTFTEITPGNPALTADVEPLVRALRPALTSEEFTVFATRAHGQGLVFLAAYDGGRRCAGVATYRLLSTSRGHLLFVEDLVTDPGLRSTGVGRRLMDELLERARQAGCARIELDTGTANHAAQRFYHARRMELVALHFALRVDSV